MGGPGGSTWGRQTARPRGPHGTAAGGQDAGRGLWPCQERQRAPAPAMPQRWQLEGLRQSGGAHPFMHRKMMGTYVMQMPRPRGASCRGLGCGPRTRISTGCPGDSHQ